MSATPRLRPQEAKRRRTCGSSARAATRWLFAKEYEANLFVCPRCEHHGRIGADARLAPADGRSGYELLNCAHGARGPAQVPGYQALHRPPQGSARAEPPHPDAVHRRQRRRSKAARPWSACRTSPSWADRWAWRPARRSAPGLRAVPARALRLRRRHRRGRRADAGRHPQPDADAQGDRDDHAACEAGRPPLHRPVSPTRPPAASPRATRCWATSTSPSRAR